MTIRVRHVIQLGGVAGAEKHILTLLEHQRAAGLDTGLIAVHTPNKPIEAFIEQAEATGAPVERVIVPYVRRLVFNRHVPLILRRLAAALRATRPDIAHTHLVYADFYGTLAARLARVPRVVVSRHKAVRYYERPDWQAVNWLMWRLRARGIAVSDAVRRGVERYERARPGQVITVHNGVDVWQDDGTAAEARQRLRGEWGIPASAPVVGSLSRLEPVKGLAAALDAFAQAREQVPGAHYVIAGVGPLREALEAQARALGVADAVHLVGWRDDVPDVLNALDVLHAPSLEEGFSLTNLEAMAHALPLVCSDIPPNQEAVVEGETGYLAPAHDASALAAPLTRLLGDLGLARRMGQAGQARQRSLFSTERMVEGITRVYEDLVESGPARFPRQL